jgi:hypothetical protein
MNAAGISFRLRRLYPGFAPQRFITMNPGFYRRTERLRRTGQEQKTARRSAGFLYVLMMAACPVSGYLQLVPQHPELKINGKVPV